MIYKIIFAFHDIENFVGVDSSESLHLFDDWSPEAARQNTSSWLILSNISSKASIISLGNNQTDSKLKTCCHGGLSRRFCGTVGDLAVDFDVFVHFLEIDNFFSFKTALDNMRDDFIRCFIVGSLLR